MVTWRSPTNETLQRQIAGYHWLTHYCGLPVGTVEIGAARLSCLVPPFCILQQKSTERMWASFGNQRWAVVTWPLLSIGVINDTKLVKFDYGQQFLCENQIAKFMDLVRPQLEGIFIPENVNLEFKKPRSLEILDS